MPYKDKNKKKEHDLAYLRNHPEKTKRYRDNWKRNRDIKQRKALSVFYKLTCNICGERDSTIKIGVCLHKKDGKPHNRDKVYKLKYILENPQEFVPLCRKHHNIVHRLMKLGLSWKDVICLYSGKPEASYNEIITMVKS
jgi:predicted HNH restriction endonuclease